MCYISFDNSISLTGCQNIFKVKFLGQSSKYKAWNSDLSYTHDTYFRNAVSSRIMIELEQALMIFTPNVEWKKSPEIHIITLARSKKVMYLKDVHDKDRNE